MINHDLFIKLLENQSINIEEEHNLYNNWLQFPNNKIKIYEYRFSNYLNKEYYIRCMSQLFSIVNFLEKNFNNIFPSYFNNSLRDILYTLEKNYEKLLKNQAFFTPFDIYKLDFLSLKYTRLKLKIKKFQEKEKELYFLLFYKGNLESINYYDLRYFIYNFLK
jgi:hypothetical protein